MSDLDNPGVKAVITLGVLIVAGIVAVITAKLVRVCMDDSYTEDQDSELSENTRELIRARLSVIQFKKKEMKKVKRQKTIDAFKKWKDFVKIHKKVGALKQSNIDNDTCVVNIEKINGVNGKTLNGTIGHKTVDFEVHENGIIPQDCSETTPRLKKLSSLTSLTPHPTTRPSQNTQKLTNAPPSVESSLPVPRGRPVSSKQRAMPNVTQTDFRRDPTMLSLKAVQYEERSVKSDQKLTGSESAKT